MFLYDLKGSTAKRLARGRLTSKTVRKDRNFIKDKKQYRKELEISNKKQKLMKLIERDVLFL